ncbi:malonyl-CoA decarboxylase [Iodidimonas sp. SYSU 1G8]|uniref:malonyl-CoA decarboxylase n=1 Tax=Iodidimonas sp. SYSU 1G8 TaxID=3133967 RepID=UPI0031FF0ED9
MSSQSLMIPPQTRETLLNRTLVRLRRAWKDVRAGAASLVESGDIGADLPPGKLETVRRQIADCINGPGGEFAARARAAELGRLYLSFNDTGRKRFLTLLAERFATEEHALSLAAALWRDAATAPERLQAERALKEALMPPRLRLLRQFNALPEGVKFLVDLRADLLGIRDPSPQLAALDDDLRELLVSWFDLGFLDLRQITWQSPAALLEKLIAYEAVHEIRSWDDLRNRLESDRRCFALFHPRMPDEPLAFVEVALVKGLAGDVQVLLDRTARVDDAPGADTAIFYSISNTQRGLQGVSFGEHLIKKAAEALSHDVPRLKQFATLSPVPGFRRWLERVAAEHAATLFQPGDAERFATLQSSTFGEMADTPDLRDFVHRMAAWYFRQRNPQGLPIDPVARFHLRNGARLERLNWPADRSANGWKQSWGLMVNYLYDLQRVETNHESYVRDGTVVVSRPLRELTQRTHQLGS